MSGFSLAGRVAVIATMHRKEAAIAPLITTAWNVKTLVPTDFDTDAFGTFTRDIDRASDQLTTARLKAEAALALTGETLALASEGSFGPHPQLPFVPYSREFVLLLDTVHQLEIVGEAVSTHTNYRSQAIASLEEALSFAKSVGFPAHGLVVMESVEAPNRPLAKGITQESDLITAVELALSNARHGKVHLETDMRALYNPTRMQAIAQATEDLIQRVAQRCPKCDCPGFSIVERRLGLPCGLCYAPTSLTLSELSRCQKCAYECWVRSPDAPDFADPGQCPYCNP
ncbi:MAG: hypothetical protein DCF15_03335 [Phormidesmis priestleyi]|uniref:DUF6671 domain-containing protein n=1 Tax=Phormidesmis priestleyi TaxID=268141 RepID=A0A2W4ZN32_9CYAN|nr:MAG: hypothetical protein DCF15_03335 [Phormidesmis priestleyi]